MMRTAIRSKDFLSGLLYLIVGAAFVIAAREYDREGFLDSSTFPTFVGSLLILVGAVVGGRSLAVLTEPSDFAKLRPMASVVGAVVIFAILLERLGVVVAIAGAILVCFFAGSGLRVREALYIFVAMIALSVGIFVYGLGLRLPLFW